MRIIGLMLALGLGLGNSEAGEDGSAAVVKAGTALASASKPPVTKIVFRAESDDIAGDSFNAKPKTLYLAGVSCARIEEEPDPEQGIHGLGITAEPDLWLINLMGRKGRHIIDAGPTYDTPMNVISME